MFVLLITDFGTKDSTVNEMKSVILSKNPSIRIEDITHNIDKFNVWEAACVLEQASFCWKKNTIFISVVDPYVGTNQQSIILRTNKDQYFISPDNGTLTFIVKRDGIKELVKINKDINKANPKNNYISSGKELYAYVAAQLVANDFQLNTLGKPIKNLNNLFNIIEPKVNKNTITGMLKSYDGYGNIWTNITHQEWLQYENKYLVKINNNKEKTIYQEVLQYCKTFANVVTNESLIFLNNYGFLSIGTNMNNFIKENNINCFYGAQVEIKRL